MSSFGSRSIHRCLSQLFILCFIVAQLIPISGGQAIGAATISVDTTANTNDGDTSSITALLADPGDDHQISFVEALAAVNSTGPGNTILFALPAGSTIVKPLGADWRILQPFTTIDGDVNGDTFPDIAITVPEAECGLTLASNDGIVRNLATEGFCIFGAAAFNNKISNNYIGLNLTGQIGLNKEHNGVLIKNDAHDNIIENNTIGGNQGSITGFRSSAVRIDNNAHHNIIRGNKIGLNVEGVVAGNEIGIHLAPSAHDNIIGGDRAGNNCFSPCNLIAGNTTNGIVIEGATTTNNGVKGNFIGTNVDGTRALPNGATGNVAAVLIYSGATNNSIGGVRVHGAFTECTGACNLISGNQGDGVYIWGTTTTGNTVEGNFIGTTINGNQALKNNLNGVVVVDSPKNRIGGQRNNTTCDESCNLISGNGSTGIMLYSGGAVSNTVQGNYIGTDKLGLSPLGNGSTSQYPGILIGAGASYNTIGGTRSNYTCDGPCNLISGNKGQGIQVQETPTTGNAIQGNFIGVNINGMLPISNTYNGVFVILATQTQIGGARPAGATRCTGPCNVVGGNQYNGIVISGPNPPTLADVSGKGVQTAAQSVLPVVLGGDLPKPAAPHAMAPSAAGLQTVVEGNFAGLNAIGDGAIPNQMSGVVVAGGAIQNRIGGIRSGTACDGPCNVISGNKGEGIAIANTGTVSTTIQGNYIGVDSTGILTQPNKFRGIAAVGGATTVLIGGERSGGDCVGACNLIRGNTLSGISLFDAQTRQFEIRANSIYENGGMSIDLGGDGYTLNDPTDADTGPNDLLNAPLSLMADYDGTRTTITGILSATNPSTFKVDIYANEKPNAKGGYDAQRFLGTAVPNAKGEFKLVLNGQLPYSDPHLAAAAIDKDGNTSELSVRTPLIFLHGVAASQLVDTADGDELWPGILSSSLRLSLLPEDNPATTIIATNPLRYLGLTGASDTPPAVLLSPAQIAYGPLLDMLQAKTGAVAGGYRLYETLGNPTRRTTAGCDMAQASNAPTLFTYAYDWRLSNIENAQRLRDFIGCVQRFYPGTKVDVLTHSMGSVVARNYVLQYPDKHDVQRMITVGAPWLGAAKLIYAMQSGDFVPIISAASTKRVVAGAIAAHQLIPGKAYYDLSANLNGAAPGSPDATLTSPLYESGWDMDGDGNDHEGYSFEDYMAMLNIRFVHTSTVNSQVVKVFLPGTTSNEFHSFSDANGNNQDDWHNDTTGVKYYHFFGVQSGDTSIGRVRAVTGIKCSFVGFTTVCYPESRFEPVLTRGDGTVPQLSAQRIGNGLNYNAPDAKLIRVCGFDKDTNINAEHTQMANNPEVHTRILSLLAQGTTTALPNCPTDGLPPAPAPGTGLRQPQATATAQPYHYITVDGGISIEVRDSQGHTTGVITGTLRGGIADVSTFILGDKAMMLVIPTGGTYTVTFQTVSDPLMIEARTGTGTTATQADRYLDLVLPASKAAVIQVTPQGIQHLRYDNDGNGSYESVVAPTVSLTGAQANDLLAPTLTAGANPQQDGTMISLSASDSGSGVKEILYSLDGEHYQVYSAPFKVNPAQTSTVYAFATDNAGNRAAKTFTVAQLPKAQLSIFIPVTMRTYAAGW